jgi:oligosaccharide translocation protein RFT1
MKNESALNKSLLGLKLMVTQQFASRIITFASNIFITRTLSLEILGMIQDLDLFHSSLLYFSRETVRLAVLRIDRKDKNSLQLAMNFACLPNLICLILMTLIAIFRTINQSYLLYMIAAWIELLAEPAYTFCQIHLHYEIRIVI